MRRRGESPGAAVGGVPAWVLSFRPEDWVRDVEVPSWWAMGAATYRYITAYQRWTDAGRAWVADNGGSRGDWYQLVHGSRVVVDRPEGQR